MSSRHTAPVNQGTGAHLVPQSLREAIARSGLTTAQLEAKVGCSRRILSNWRNGARPSDHFIAKLSEVLQVDLWPLYQADVPPKPPTPLTQHPRADPASVPAHPVVTCRASGSCRPTSRLLAPADTYEWYRACDAFLSAHAIDGGTRAYLHGQLARLWDLFHGTEGETSVAALSTAVNGHKHALLELAQWPLAERDRNWLLGALSEADILAGRLARDQLNPQTAIALHRYAMALAQQTGDPNLMTASAMRLAETLLDAGLPYEALAYCDAAIPGSRDANARIAGELLGLAAEVHSVLGDRSHAQRLVNDAARLAVGAVALPTAGGINFSETAAAEYQANEALRRQDLPAALGHINRALQLLATEFQGAHNIRWQAHLYIDRARIHRSSRELEAACDDLRKASRLSRSISSRIGLRKVQDAASDLMQAFAPHPLLVQLREDLLQLCRPEMTEHEMGGVQ